MSLNINDISTIVKTWPALTAIVAFIMLILGTLSTTGYIDPALHRSDATPINEHIKDIDEKLQDNKQDHKDIREQILSIISALARIEGRLGSK